MGGLGDIIAVSATTAATDYQAIAVPLPLTGTRRLRANSILWIKYQVYWSGLSGATNRNTKVGYGRTFAGAMAGGSSSATGRLVFSQSDTSTAEKMDITTGFAVGANLNFQTHRQASTGDESQGTNSAGSTGVVTLDQGDCYLYVGLNSTAGGEVLNISSWRCWLETFE